MAPQQEIRFCKASDGVDLAMSIYGSGPPLVRAATWLTHMERDLAHPTDRAGIDEFSQRFSFVTYDSRGCGLSQRNVENISFDAWVRDLETVVDALGLESFPLFGASQGAAIAVAYAARHPERVSRLILFGGFATSYFTAHKVSDKLIEEAETPIKLVELGWGSPQPAFRQVFVSHFMPDATTEQRQRFDELQKATATPEMAARYLRGMFSVNVREQAAQVRCPTLVLHVKGDQLIYFEQGRRLAALIPGARFVPLEGNNHIPFDYEPGWLAAVQHMRSFLGAGAPAPAPAPGLTPRQREVLRQVAFGRTDKEIARDLELSPRTVEMHVAGALKCLGAKTRAEAVRAATEQRLIEPAASGRSASAPAPAAGRDRRGR